MSAMDTDEQEAFWSDVADWFAPIYSIAGIGCCAHCDLHSNAGCGPSNDERREIIAKYEAAFLNSPFADRLIAEGFLTPRAKAGDE